jgi:ribonuclease I
MTFSHGRSRHVKITLTKRNVHEVRICTALAMVNAKITGPIILGKTRFVG